MDKQEVHQELLDAAHEAAGLARGAIMRAGRDTGDSDGNSVVEVEGYANAAKALAEAAAVANRV
jgi:hypothetical protein